jgi:phage shock protein C
MSWDIALLLAFVLSLSFLGALATLGGGVANLQKLRKASYSYPLGGVCTGLGETTQVPIWLWRTVFVLFALCGGLGIILYLLLWIFLPRAEFVPQPAASTAVPAP